MTTPQFARLNDRWNAEPNAPNPEVDLDGSTLRLTFDVILREQAVTLVFTDCQRWRLGLTNDEGWYSGQCRYSKAAPAWGEFYELLGYDEHRDLPDDWQHMPIQGAGERHFLFYFRDETFECLASGWSFAQSVSGNEGLK